jgi:excisionase family DNA binding protein
VIRSILPGHAVSFLYEAAASREVSMSATLELLTTDEVAAALKITPRTVRNWAAVGRLERIRIGAKFVRYRLSDVEALIDSSTSETDAGNVGLAEGRGAGAHGQGYS